MSDVNEAKVDAGKSPETKEKERNIRKFGVNWNQAGHGKLRRALHRSNRGDKKIKGDKSQYVETESYRVMAKDPHDTGKPSTFSYKDEKDAKKFADSIKKDGGRATVSKEETVVELNRYEKETGKSSGSMNMPKGKPTKKGGDDDPVMRAVRSSIRRETGRPEGQQKKVKGEKGKRQIGDRKFSPADTIAKRRQSKKDAEKLMRDTSGT